ncbi:metallophosphoesterase family protein [Liquorilactobacillus hordei]|uniref:metallophosphoesterase family protein n=1 Tax=Liquorilactobacillus hordei TaxID=468911 RepID=UPI0039EC6158
MTKIAIFSDIHGNLSALNAFYEDAKKENVDDYWFLGDTFGPGPDVQEVWDKLLRINPSVRIRGNWEDFLIKAFLKKGDLSDSIKTIENYVIERLDNPADVCKVVEEWPLHVEKEIDGVRIGLSHNLPDDNQGDSLSVRAESINLKKLFEEKRRNLDIAIFAHIHHPTMRYIDLNCLNNNTVNYDYNKADERLILNVGSIGLPFDKPTHLYKEKRAEYLLLEVGNQGDINPQFKRINYDISCEFENALSFKLPFRKQYLHLFKI